MTIEDHPTEIALIDRNDNLVVMGRKTYDRLYEEANTLLRERDEARAELARIRAVEATQSHILAEMSDTPAEKRVSDLEFEAATLRAELERMRGRLARTDAVIENCINHCTNAVCAHDHPCQNCQWLSEARR